MSPSVYVVYTSLFAQPPGGENLDNHIGGDYKDVTHAYLPSDISTLPGNCWDAKGQWQTLRIEDLEHPPQNWQSSQRCQFPFVDPTLQEFGGLNGTKMAARPLVRLPPDLRNLDPLWARCGVNEQSWDPPRALTPVAAMEASTTPPSSSATTPARIKHTAGVPAPTALPSSAVIPSMSFVPAPFAISISPRPGSHTQIKQDPSIHPEISNQEESQALSLQASMTTREHDGMARLSSRLASSDRDPSSGQWNGDLIEERPSQTTVPTFSKLLGGKASLISAITIAISGAVPPQRSAIISQENDSKIFATHLGPSLVSPTPTTVTDTTLSSSDHHKSANKSQGSIAILSTSFALQYRPNGVASNIGEQAGGLVRDPNEYSTYSQSITDHSRGDDIVSIQIKPATSSKTRSSSASSVNTAVDAMVSTIDTFSSTSNSRLVPQASPSVSTAIKTSPDRAIYPVMFALCFSFAYHNRL